MNCFPCFSSQKSKMESNSKNDHEHSFHPEPHVQPTEHVTEAPTVTPADYETGSSINAFNFREMLSATKNFRQEFLLGEGSHGKVYKGTLQGKDVAVKQLDRNAMEGNNEFFVEVGQLSLIQHPNLVSLIGYCNDGDQRLLVYEFMSGGSLEDHLHGTKGGGKPLDWVTRMKIAYGAAEGLQYLHEKAKPAVLYRDLQSSKILLDDEFNPKLSNVGLDRLGSSADTKMPMQMDNMGYTAPELTNSGAVSTMTDVYSFGVILLELITGRKPIDEDQQTLVDWAQPIFKEPKHFPDMADPLLKKQFPERGLNQAVAIAAMCVQEEAAARPLISDLASVLSFLSIAKEENNIPPTLPPTISSKLHCISDKLQFLDCNDQSGKRQAPMNDPIPEGDEEGESDDEEDEGSTSGGSDEETDQPNKGDEDHGDGSDHGDGDHVDVDVDEDGDHGDGDEDHGDGDEDHGDGDEDEDHGDEYHGDEDHGNGNRSLSQKSSGRSMFSVNNDGGRETNSMSRKESKKSESYSSCVNEEDDEDGDKLAEEDDDDGNKLVASSSGDLSDAAADAAAPDASTPPRNKKTKKKMVDEKGANDSSGKKKKSSDKIKSRKSTKKKKNKDENSKSSTKKSNGESNSPSSVKKNRHKSKKRVDKDDDLGGESQPEN